MVCCRAWHIHLRLGNFIFFYPVRPGIWWRYGLCSMPWAGWPATWFVSLGWRWGRDRRWYLPLLLSLLNRRHRPRAAHMLPHSPIYHRAFFNVYGTRENCRGATMHWPAATMYCICAAYAFFALMRVYLHYSVAAHTFYTNSPFHSVACAIPKPIPHSQSLNSQRHGCGAVTGAYKPGRGEHCSQPFIFSPSPWLVDEWSFPTQQRGSVCHSGYC